jgi:hypothetical protein
MQSGEDTMEYENNDTGWAFGVIDRELSNNCGKIMVLAKLDEQKKPLTILDEKSAKEEFYPWGGVFGPSLFEEYKKFALKIGDPVIFKFQPNEEIKNDGDDRFIVTHKTLNKKGYLLHKIEDNLIENGCFIDLERLNAELNIPESKDLYLRSSTSIIGPFFVENDGEIRVKDKKKVHSWKISDCNIIKSRKGLFLIEVPSHDVAHDYLDCMKSEQLSEWFRERIKEIDSSFVDELDKRTDWRKKMAEIIEMSKDTPGKLVEFRLSRVMKCLDNLKLEKTKIQSFAESSDEFRKIYEKSIVELKEEYKNEFEEEYREEMAALEQKKSKAQADNQKLKEDIKNKERQQEHLNKEIADHRSNLEHFEKQRERLMKDFSLLQYIGDVQSKSPVNTTTAPAYLIEEVKPGDKEIKEIKNKEEFLGRLEHFFALYGINKTYSKRFLNAAAAFKCFLIPDAKLGLAFAEAVCNTKYIIQQVEPDWLHFRNLWKNGLGELWESSHNEPEKLHLLILEDINLASPECWGRPLFDMMSGLRERIPFGGTPWPRNFKIAATKLPSIEPPIGLPVYKQTFAYWGACHFSKSFLDSESEPLPAIKEGYTKPLWIDEWKPDDIEIESMVEDVINYIEEGNDGY